MKPTWVLSEEERERRFRRVRERQQDNAGVTPMATDQSDEHSSNSFTEQPEQAVQKMEPMHLVTIQQTHANGSAKVSTHDAVIAPQPPPAVMKTEIEPSSLKSSHIDGYSMDNVQVIILTALRVEKVYQFFLIWWKKEPGPITVLD